MRKLNNCVDCGKPIKKESTRCHSCSNKKNNIGRKASDEAKKNMSKASKGKKKPQSMIDKITGKGNYFFGKKHSKESLQKMKDVRTGVPLSKSHRQSIGLGHKGVSLTEQHKINISNAQKGDKCYSWKGGITPLNHAIRNSKKYADWRTQVFGRDNFTCQECKARGVWIEAHHEKSFAEIIKDNRIKTIGDADSCDELWSISNGITLCKKCHKQLHSKLRRQQKSVLNTKGLNNL